MLDQYNSLSRGGSFQAICQALSAYLETRTYMVGNDMTVADLTILGQLSSTRQWEAISRLPSLAHLRRWFNTCLSHDIVAEVYKVASVGQVYHTKQTTKQGDGSSKCAAKSGSFDINLENASKGNVVTRFPPEPSGYLHIGHAKAALLNQYFAKAYQGKLIIRFDDTNPSKEKDEFVENILSDCRTLELEADQISYTSDYFPKIIEIGTKLIKEGNIYIDDTPKDKMREERIDRIDSVARANTVDENLNLWQSMISGDETGLKCAARFRMDMQNDNGALRDPVAFRCNLTPHHRTGTTFKVYPTYDCACPFVDAIEVRISHSFLRCRYSFVVFSSCKNISW
jgi:glutamyl-tRNA synthetase